MLDKVIKHIKKDGIQEVSCTAYRYMLSNTAPSLMAFFRLFGIHKAVVFSHFDGKAYGGNPAIICDEMIYRKLPYKLIWVTEKKYMKSLPAGIKWVPTKSLRQLWALATSKVWIDDCRKSSCFRKGRKQYYIQTWHGGGPCLKKIEADAIEALPLSYIKDAINDSSMADLFMSACVWRSHNYRNAFWYDGEILECGTPASDVYGKEPELIRNEVCNFFDIEDSTHIALYAPTFRNTQNVDCYRMDFEKVIQSLESKFGGEWNFIVRLHPSIMNLSGFISYSNNVLNASEYPQFENLLIASDVLITDYSGCMFEAFRLKKNVFLYTSDLISYMANERSLYFDINALPASVSLTSDELISNIMSFERDIYEKKVNVLLDQIGYYPFGNATNAVIDRIINFMEGKRK